MKTLEEMYNEILKSEELKKALAEAIKGGKAEDFLKAHGCVASAADVFAFLREQRTKSGELIDDDLDSVAGGWATPQA